MQLSTGDISRCGGSADAITTLALHDDTSSTAIVPSASNTAGSMLRLKYITIMSTCKLLFDMMAKDDWHVKVKESHFTKPLLDIGSLRQQAKTEACGNLVKEIDEYENGIAHVKVFLRKYRDYCKSYKTAKMTTLHPFVKPAVAFLLEQEGLTVAPHILRLAATTCFQHGVEANPGDLLEIMRDLADTAAMKSFADLGDGVEQSADCWIHEIIFFGFEAWMKQHVEDTEGIDKIIESMSEILTGINAALQKICKTGVAATESLKEASALKVMFNFAADRIEDDGYAMINKELVSSLQHYQSSKGFADLRRQMSNHPSFQEVLERCTHACRRSARDDVGMRRLQIVSKNICGQNIIHIVPPPSDDGDGDSLLRLL